MCKQMVQVPVLTYETLFRDETLLTNKMLTDYGPKIECTLDEVLSLKLFVYPIVLLLLVTIASLILLCHHWQVTAVKIRLGVAALLCVVVNVGWGICYFLVDKQWRDMGIIAGLQANVYLMLLIVVLPKIVGGCTKSRHSVVPTTGSAKDFEDVHPGEPHYHQQRRHEHSGNHIYAIPHEFDRRSEDLPFDHSTAM